MKLRVLARLAMVVPLVTILAQAQPAQACSGAAWTQITTPNPSGTWNEFKGIDLSSSSEGWAVGLADAGGMHGAVARWDGATWNLSSGAALGSWSDEFLDVKSFSASSAWLVGSVDATGTSRNQVLAEYWNGSSWSVAVTPTMTKHPTALGLDGNSSSNMWAVGSLSSATYSSTPFAMRWNGSTWTAASPPKPRHTTSSSLNDVAVLSNRNAWAVGSKQTAGGGRTLVEHWSHGRWSAVPSPNPAGDSALTGVWAASSRSIWAVGFTNGTGSPSAKTLLMHWNGRKWTIKSSPNPGSGQNSLWDIDGTSSGDFWAVGSSSDSGSGIPSDTMALMHSGTTWTQESAAIGGDLSLLTAVDANAGSPLAVGWRNPVISGPLYTLGEQHC